MTIMTTRPWGMWWIMIGTVAAVHARVSGVSRRTGRRGRQLAPQEFDE